jgi:hypothetical protein
MEGYFRFKFTFGLLSHLLKSTFRQDRLALKPLISAHLPKNGVAIDVGAHGGQVSRLLADCASLVSSASHVEETAEEDRNVNDWLAPPNRL